MKLDGEDALPFMNRKNGTRLILESRDSASHLPSAIRVGV